MLRRIALGDGARVATLVVALVGEADRERADGLRRRLRHEADDDARVDAAREQRAQRHVGDQAAADGRFDALADEREPVALALRPELLELRVPLKANRAVLRDEHVPRRQLLDALETRPARDVLEREVRVDRDRVDLTRHPRQAQQRLQLGGERERAVRELRPQERLLADSVASEHEAFARLIPERDREHPRQVLGEPRPVLLVQVRDDGRVAGAADLVPAPGEVLAELEEVVDLAVEDRDDVPRLVLDGLAAGDEVDDLQAPVAEHAASIGVDRALVRAAMDERGVHPLDDRPVSLAARVLGIRRCRT